MTELSRAAQAVLDAAIKVAESPDAEAIAAAALEAAADQVVPEENEPANAFEEEGYVPGRLREQRQHTRTQLLAIVAELKAHD
jgi:hypothetical protein